MPATTKKIVVAVLLLLVLIGGFVAGLILVRQRQNIQEQAAVPGGQATISITPTSGTYNIGDTVPVEVSFNTAGIAVSGVVFRLTYPYSGTSSEVSVSNLEISSALLSTGDWSCPTKTAQQQNGTVMIDVGCANTSASGFSSTTNTLLARFNLSIDSAPAANPVVLTFDSTQSVITKKSDNSDILLIPSSTGTYTVAGAQTSSPTPTTIAQATVTPTIATTATPTPTTRLTATPTSTSSATLTPTTTTTKGGLPEAGYSLPTIIGIGTGSLLIILALVLAI